MWTCSEQQVYLFIQNNVEMFINETVDHLGDSLHWQTLYMIWTVNCGMYGGLYK